MVDVKALRELAEDGFAAYYDAACSEDYAARSRLIAAAEVHRLALLALLGVPGDDALPEGWTRTRTVPECQFVIYEHEEHGHQVTIDRRDDEVDVHAEYDDPITATELHAVLTHYLSRKGSDR